MAYYYPFGIPQSGFSSSFATTTISASAASSTAITGYTASYAAGVQTAGPQGPSGSAPSCGTGPQGPTGPTGPSGSIGPSLTTCPPGSKQCTGITPPAGYIIVCIEIPSGCTAQTTYCPGETPPAVCYTHSYASVGSLTDCGTLQSLTLYSTSFTLDVGSTVYSNSGCSSTFGAGFIQNGGDNFEVNSSGLIISKSAVTC